MDSVSDVDGSGVTLDVVVVDLNSLAICGPRPPPPRRAGNALVVADPLANNSSIRVTSTSSGETAVPL